MKEDSTYEAAQIVSNQSSMGNYDLALVLGSGFDYTPEHFKERARIAYNDLPGLPTTTVSGHTGELLCGETDSLRILIFRGRFHLYEGHSARQATAHIRLAAALGCTRLILTNAVGGINPQYRTGDFMWIYDHLNMTGDNPLTGIREEPFIDLSSLYDEDPFRQVSDALRDKQVILHKGVLGVMRGPSYETPAEIRMLRTLGADAVGMSVAPEAIMAKYLKMSVMAVSRITNPAAGLSETALSHDDVLNVAKAGQPATNLLLNQLFHFIRNISATNPATTSTR